MSRTYYILSEGELRADEGVFRFDNADGPLRIPVERVRGLEVHSGCTITTGALKLAGEFNIPIHVFGHYGNYMGSYWPKDAYFSGDLTIKQSLLYADPARRLDISKRLVHAVAANMVSLLAMFDGDTTSLDDPLETNRIEGLMLLEARIRREYYARLDQVIPEDFMLMKREKRPPTNYGNCLVSFGNSLLYSALLTEARNTSINITIPFYHEPMAGRFALALDISELFKPGMVDRFIIQLTRQGIIRPGKDHFAREGEGLLLTSVGRKIFLEQWDKWLSTTSDHPRMKRKVANRELLRFELHRFAKEVEGIERYVPIRWPEVKCT